MEHYERGKLDGQMLQEMKDMNNHLIELKDLVKGQEARIRILENWRWWLLGASATIGIGAAKITHASISSLTK
jgi:hypothetical protein